MSGLAEFRKILAYMKKEFIIEKSYKFSYLFLVFGIFTSISTYFFIDRLFGSRVTPELAPYGVSYFSYVLIGNAFFTYVGTALGGISGRISTEQERGTLETLFMTPTKLWVLLLGMAIWNVFFSSIQVVIYFFVGSVGFGVDFARINWGGLAGILGLVVVAFNSLGLIEAASILVFKRGGITAWVFNSVWALLGGVFFPVAVLPSWLQKISVFNPITYAIRGLQLAIYQGASIRQLEHEMGILLSFCIILVPLGIASWSWALRRVKIDGSLSLY